MAHIAAARTKRLLRPLAQGAVLLAAGTAFTVAASWWFATDGWVGGLTNRPQESFVARGDGPQPFACRKRDAWGMTRWETSPAGGDSAGTPLELPVWVMPAAGKDDICETEAFGWPMRAMYRQRVLTRIP